MSSCRRLPDDKADNRILKVCQGLKEEGPILVTKDLVLRLKAQILGIEAEDFSTEQVIPEEDQYTGRLQCYVPEDKFKDFKKKGVPTKDVYLSDAEGNTSRPDLTENQFVILKADQSLRKTHLGRVKGKKIVPLEYKKSQPYGVKPRNSGQYFLQEALMKPADEAPLVIVKGQAGHGQDLLRPGCRTGENRQPPDRRVPAHPRLPSQRPVRLGHRLSARRRAGKDFAPHAAHHRQPGAAHRRQRGRAL